MSEPSKKRLKALSILKNHEDGITAKFFAWEMWPDSPAWDRVYNTGINGATSGKGMWLSAGSYLSKLVYEELAWADYPNGYTRTYHISSKGRRLLQKQGETSDE